MGTLHDGEHEKSVKLDLDVEEQLAHLLETFPEAEVEVVLMNDAEEPDVEFPLIEVLEI